MARYFLTLAYRNSRSGARFASESKSENGFVFAWPGTPASTGVGTSHLLFGSPQVFRRRPLAVGEVVLTWELVA